MGVNTVEKRTKKPFIQRKWWKITALILAVVLLFFVICWVLPRPQSTEENIFVVGKNNRPLLIAHGGGNGEFPDNTLEAFINAYGVDKNVMMETDVSMTKDGKIILSHDTTLGRKTNIDEEIIKVDYSWLMESSNGIDFNYNNASLMTDGRWNAGISITNLIKYKTNEYAAEQKEVSPTDVNFQPAINDGLLPSNYTTTFKTAFGTQRSGALFKATLLEELIATFPQNTVNVEIKQSGEIGIAALAEVIKVIERQNAFDRVVVASFHKEVYNKMVEYQKNSHESLMYSPEQSGVIKFFILQLLGIDVFFNEKITVFQVPMKQMGIKVATRGFIRKAHKHKIAVHFWTINNPADMRRLCDIGADGIMTDNPSNLFKVLNEKFS